jgi:hypothetical protein
MADEVFAKLAIGAEEIFSGNRMYHLSDKEALLTYKNMKN